MFYFFYKIYHSCVCTALLADGIFWIFMHMLINWEPSQDLNLNLPFIKMGALPWATWLFFILPAYVYSCKFFKQVCFMYICPDFGQVPGGNSHCENHNVIPTTEVDVVIAVQVEIHWSSSERSISLTKTSTERTLESRFYRTLFLYYSWTDFNSTGVFLHNVY